MRVLGDRRFRRLLAGQTLSGFGDSALYLTLGIWVKALTGSDGAAGAVFLCLGLPALGGPLYGRLADRMSRRTLQIAVNLATMLVVLCLLAVRGGGQLWIIFAVALWYGAASGIGGAASAGFRRDLLADGDLGAANALLLMSSQGVRILSPLVGAALFEAAGGGAVAVLDAVSFVAAILALASVHVEESIAVAEPRERFLRGAAAGLRHIRSVRLLAQVTYAAAGTFAVIGLNESVIFAVVAQGLHRAPGFLGLLNAVQGAGAVIGGLTANAMLRRLGAARMAGAAIAAFTLASLGYRFPDLATVCAAEVADGVALVWLMMVFATATQQHTPSHLQGRVNAAGMMLILTPQTVSIACGAAFIGVLGYRTLLLAMTAVTAACAVPLLAWPASDLRSETIAPFARAAASPPAPRSATSAGSGTIAARNNDKDQALDHARDQR
ncbi:MFS transporter [Actinocrinis puniceicyclus]|uniref:MFS transporter n=1 Tax=Actinocrinis puniceicyclus TaxID=977794 RepID=A0A8J7WN21_9ACTN|nr:MFS transporter [Actinocrinis puniceicyclus]MBS2965383.1 MFS transporter [Actinocrinis puniceicyclus]